MSTRSLLWNQLRAILKHYNDNNPDDIQKIITSYRDSTLCILKEEISSLESKLKEKNSEKKEKEKCSICYEDLHDKAALECGHYLHHKCMRQLFFLYKDDKCPLCRLKYKWEFNTNKNVRSKQKKKIKDEILKFLGNKVDKKSSMGRLMISKDVSDLTMFLFARDIHFEFLDKITHILIKADWFDITQWIEEEELYSIEVINKRFVAYDIISGDISLEDESDRGIYFPGYKNGCKHSCTKRILYRKSRSNKIIQP